ncbi:bifunctional adenosylcobinamide kinase/adenosylcobinamide-phosphate guanylyltransferase [Trinickia caryophylli]|uniref:Bifunctional adenosylcobalamin biosynthesis protein n=1 Tax=Trinickia caryophylli TaxID=28094 RepID=A0A1X7GXG8_TRICW|nr:bifunctional adenosylcobinamide kinase/adenosylcobinamide-phosphate guanylyltransferase [Trinickia caryophylli]PMS10154.1 bifunctional adenosylcobinamide kinase/adenosylcobinamide-phosphate guanylyltransferase [Trinickia caryophylli]TRX18254.1 bifunctional adenosylcobinamide kinase/adenosylcobinamide-phosphate guanylyltransferase [Trinickia caryophylli]WQE10959.1 bifunctional adenosylcobinamide kinase/adenosylcobinamide-phosphate guanylyltransferase [Trinickia caryophylli]SMF76271.1 adenosyl
MTASDFPDRPDLLFVLGGARSGKSAYAEQLAAASERPVTYIATAQPDAADGEFAARIAHHRARRPAHWGLVEAAADLPQALARADSRDGCVLVDCLTLWLAQLLCPVGAAAEGNDASDGDDARATAHLDAFVTALSAARGRIIVVSNEIGLGVVPLGSLTRRYVDELGRLNQRVAAAAREVTLMVAGLPMPVKTSGPRP